MEDRLVELEALQKALLEGTGMLDSMNISTEGYVLLPFTINPQSLGDIFCYRSL